MKAIDIYMFRRLTLDLGFEWIGSDSAILAFCQDLKRYLTLAAEDDHITRWEPVEKLVRAHLSYEGFALECEHPNVFSALYQIACWPLKIKTREVTHEQEQAYISSFVKNEEACKDWTPDEDASSVISLARSLLHRALPGLDLSCESIRCWFRHGPGATYESVSGDDKNFFEVPTRVTYQYPEDAFYANEGLAFDCLSGRSRDGYLANHARLTLVPKDHKGPRGVFIHPVATVMVQQAQCTALRAAWKRGPYAKCYNPEDQGDQRSKAFIGSAAKWFYTLDLKDASDRIPVKLVALLFRSWALPLMATRVTHVEMPGGETLPLRMFAPMGAPVCFDVLSLVVWSIASAATALKVVMPGDRNWRATLLRLQWIERHCENIASVIGDDLTGDTRYYAHAVSGLQAVNLVVNRNKSFVTGYFREACGMDAYKGVDVTPLRQKVSLSDEADVIGLIELHNRVARFRSSWLRVVYLLRDRVRSILRFTLALTRNSVREPLLLQALPGEDVIGWNFFHSDWRFDVTYGELRIVYRKPSVRRDQYPTSCDRRFDLSYWLIRKNHSVDVTIMPYAATTKVVTGSPLQKERDDAMMLALEKYQRRRNGVRKAKVLRTR